MAAAGADLAIPLADGNTLEAELFLPMSNGPYPAVLVLHESFGLNDDMRRIASRFAEEGYAALVPNLFSHGSRIVCLSRVMTDMVRGAIDREIADILAARAALAERPDVDADRIAVAGFCLGGGFALIAATKPGFRAAAVNYGDVPKDRAKLDGVCPVVASFGGRDRMFGRNMAERLEEHLSTLGVSCDVQTYPQAGHSFFSHHEGWQGVLARIPTPMAVAPDEAASADGWKRMLAFFEEHVRGDTSG
ncbi:MAG TPA: dienelactone hydrolase family protein [Solirubrobacteraceae bacterium]|nr:dienelactone hydrolase family protein [Solirubrobacteraceae bacterium]